MDVCFTVLLYKAGIRSSTTTQRNICAFHTSFLIHLNFDLGINQDSGVMAYRPSDEKTPILFIKYIFGILRAPPLIVIDSCSSSPAYITYSFTIIALELVRKLHFKLRATVTIFLLNKCLRRLQLEAPFKFIIPFFAQRLLHCHFTMWKW